MKPPRGFTFVELVVAVFLAGIVAAAAGVIYLINSRSFREGRGKAVLQQNAAFCLEAISRDVRGAARVQVPTASRLVLLDVDGVLLADWRIEGGDEPRLKRGAVVMAPEDCSHLAFRIANPDSSTVAVELELRDEALNKVRIDSQITLRNRYAASN